MAILKKKNAGFYFLMVACLVGAVVLVRYTLWATALKELNPLILAALIVGVCLDIALYFYDNRLIVIATVGCYSIALFQLLSASVGLVCRCVSGHCDVRRCFSSWCD